ncbi:MAG: type IV secretion system protein [Alphaproteobacteria bacterium]|nr:type IV secretion system protein [Alphaproteobacteria bacterium]
MAVNKLEGSRILEITDGNREHRLEFIEQYEQDEKNFKLKYYMWLVRFFIFLTILSLSLFTSASLALFRLAPQVTVKPFLVVSQDSSEGIVRAESIGINMPSRDKLVDMYIRQYIELRNTIINDEIEMRNRWLPGGMVNFLSSPYVFDEFSVYRDKLWNDVIGKGIVQETEIIAVRRIGGQHSPVWKVDFKTYMLSPKETNNVSQDMLMTVRYWTASITAVFIKERMFSGMRLINPLGFTVLRYSQTQVEGL